MRDGISCPVVITSMETYPNYSNNYLKSQAKKQKYQIVNYSKVSRMDLLINRQQKHANAMKSLKAVQLCRRVVKNRQAK